MDKRKKFISFIIVIALSISALSSIIIGIGNLVLSEGQKNTSIDIKLELIFSATDTTTKNYKTEKNNLKAFLDQTGIITFNQSNENTYIETVLEKKIDTSTEKYVIYKNNTQIDNIDQLSNIPIYNNDTIKIENKKLEN